MPAVHIGTMGWSYDFWVGSFYPPGTKPKDFLTEYSRHFDTVEVNNTFYRIPSKDTFMKWKEQTPKEFLFSLKFPQAITHKKMLKDCKQETSFFLDRVSMLGDKVGPLLLQFPQTFEPAKIPLLEDFLHTLPGDYRFAVEVRNKKLFDERLLHLLKKEGVAMVVNSMMPETAQATTDFTYIRWEGDRTKVSGALGRVEVDRTEEIVKWTNRIGTFLDNVKEVFGYFSKYFSGDPPLDARKLVEELKLSSKA